MLAHLLIYFLLIGMLYALNWPIEKISNSIVSKLVDEDEVGTAFYLLYLLYLYVDLSWVIN